VKVTQVHSPHAIQQTTTNTQAQQQAKERAVAKLMGQPAQQVVQNQSQVQPEEMGAITPQVPRMTNQNATTVDPAAEQAPEAPVQNAQQPPSKPTPPDAQLQALVRREKAIRIQAQKQQDAFKAKEAELAKRQAELDAKQKELEEGYVPKSRIKQEALTVLSENEVTYDQLTQQALEAQNVNPQVKAYLTKLESIVTKQQEKLEQLSQQQENSQVESTQAALKQIAKDANTLVNKDASGSYEFIKHYGKPAIQEVVKLIETEFNETGEQLDIDEACRLVEAEYEERFNKMTSLKKVQTPLKAPTEQPTETAKTQAPNQQSQQMKTLTNAVGSTRQLSAKERAILAFEGKLKT
jgi:hypothetical protein